MESKRAIALAACLALAGCGGGGGGGSSVAVSFATGTATLAEDAASASVEVVLHSKLPALTEPAVVDVVDAGTGTAVAGSDYAFAPQTITFPVGSLDGDSQTITLDPLDDLLVEGRSETARLALQNPVGTAFTGFTLFTTTITDIHVGTIGFATGSSSTPDESNSPYSVALELDLASSVTLGVDVSVRVSDLRTGSAAAAYDYSAFPAKTVTFPAGSGDGALQTVSIQVLDDPNLENDETVQLGLSLPSAGITLGPSQYALSILDDDALTNAVFVGTEGPTGTTNALAYDEIVDLGFGAVGGGPNAGTLVRIANGGGVPMDLGAPSLAGSHPNDFAIEIESAPLAGPAPEALAPLLTLDADGSPGVRLVLDAARLAELAKEERSTWQGVVVPGLGALTLDLVRRSLPITDDCVLRVDGQELAGGLRTLVGDLQLWSGTAREFPGSSVFLALASTGVQGWLELPSGPERLVHFLADASSSAGAPVVRALREPELQALGVAAEPVDLCAGERFVPGRDELPAPSSLVPPTGALTVADCRLALETDTQFFQKFASSTELANYVTQLIGAVSERYFTDVQATLSIAYLGIHTGPNDGWSTQEAPGADTSDLLDEFQSSWSSNWPAQADLAHFLSGASLGGGIAYVDVLCNPSFGFGVSANLTGAIDWTTWTGVPAGFTWDFVVVAHELGHNFGSLHTHAYCPPLDTCYANCNGTTTCTRGTIMSYCHGCGGMANIDLEFHPVCANFMRQNINTSCLGEAALAAGDHVQYLVRFNPQTMTGARIATLSFVHSGANENSPFRIRLTGTGF